MIAAPSRRFAVALCHQLTITLPNLHQAAQEYCEDMEAVATMANDGHLISLTAHARTASEQTHGDTRSKHAIQAARYAGLAVLATTPARLKACLRSATLQALNAGVPAEVMAKVARCLDAGKEKIFPNTAQ